MVTFQIKPIAITALVLGSTVLLSACFGPTYGTGKTSGQHLFDDLGGALSLAPKDRNKAKIEYGPRPDIVKPANTGALPEPQQKIADTSADWPESPEEKRRRILTEIEAGNRPGNFVTSKQTAADLGASEGPGRATVTGRRIYLTDPPTEYRQPAQTAAIGELGETEASKERAARRAQGKGKKGWRRLAPWL